LALKNVDHVGKWDDSGSMVGAMGTAVDSLDIRRSESALEYPVAEVPGHLMNTTRRLAFSLLSTETRPVEKMGIRVIHLTQRAYSLLISRVRFLNLRNRSAVMAVRVLAQSIQSIYTRRLTMASASDRGTCS
jgi:hypothetical protein